MLHSFEYEDAEATFTAVLRGDHNCAMAYWGPGRKLLPSPLAAP
jgi:hypothetical protein